ncbi:hypothetical protein PCASD_02068 [Puccinia coronata f. sp. avenae]|uniref:Uncharacterized protein n=1 Tax=Puccinia coronata f. sp. avenae TaxID=200324 RepID=A0A2N5VQ55_9BASI|nr:hypothetical protein PCASD_02068 [Puccinia coronata f. sp. avenae]
MTDSTTAMKLATHQQVQLFGGAIVIDLPPNIVDVSTFRQVPDTQEVFIINPKEKNERDEPTKEKEGQDEEENSSSLMKDLSMIVEVLESVDLNDNPEYHQPPSTGSSVDPGGYPRAIMKYHFDALAHDNSAQLATIKSIELPDNVAQFTEPPAPQSGVTGGAGGPRRTPEPVTCYGQQSVSKFNASASESHDVHIWLSLWRLNGVGNNGRGTDLVLTFNLPHLPTTNPAHFQRSFEYTRRIFHHSARSLRIVDWTLFS